MKRKLRVTEIAEEILDEFTDQGVRAIIDRLEEGLEKE